jgi:ADP-ribosylglycohydrolase
VHDALDLRDVLADEINQRTESGFETGDLADRARRAIAEMQDPQDETLVLLLRLAEETRRARQWPHAEIDAATELLARVPDLPRVADVGHDLPDRLLGAWLGRCIGCLLGKPIEGWSSDDIRRYLESVDAWPLASYVPAVRPHPAWSPPFKPSWPEATRDRIRGMPRDDDLDYSVVALLVLERTAGRPTADDIADEWLRRLPIGQIFTAERAAYRNLVDGLRPPASALYRNPYREWVGALIRADVYAYVSPGDPAAAVRLAAIDASVSHVGSGVSAAMWAAAVISLALAGAHPTESVPSATTVVPAGTRLHDALAMVIELHRLGASWGEVHGQIQARLGRYSWVHAIPNVAIIAASLLWGDGHFDRSIALAASAGGDTDSTGATVGSASGALVGARSLRAEWVEPLHDTLRTAVAGLGELRISDLVGRTAHLVGAPHGTGPSAAATAPGSRR